MLSRLLPDFLRGARSRMHAIAQGRDLASAPIWAKPAAGLSDMRENDLRAFFESNLEGPGLWKWTHYFEIYDRHLARFRGKSPVMAEIGVYSGGSLNMWRSYFGAGAHIHGIDIEPDCEVYRGDGVDIHIGDQADPRFWQDFRKLVPQLDILIDDGGHEPHQQLVTMQEMLPHLKPGGIFICEDIHGDRNIFVDAVYGIAASLNAMDQYRDLNEGSVRQHVPVQGARAHVASVNFYPFAVVIEMREHPISELLGRKQGTRWQPFLS
ncbi:class I SAM-dependent methyltransferase [Sphingomonas immobilis]|uniref:Class I SAM-dependent methyltransferase n=1 Tax=Sphingomonas immobilis TaxID=3063997 RepID=A0ABT8ZTN6_9SPHN|nr:class I SAM-dependent methyltransferase [Sphingomonas sp. CA1-15]MDO7840925.1 class I SAM-dependent methyltransferase [Sphingomonas sp. CA1-15]